jgi:phosphodiesterase/alkaline phosphatase D-like protein
MHRFPMFLAAACFVATTADAQLLPPAPRALHVALTRAPDLELTSGDLAVVRWTTNNPGGSDVHVGVVRYGTDPSHLTQVARSPIRLNRAHTETTFRVRITGLAPRTRYYYEVSSFDSAGRSDEVATPIASFATVGSGERFVAR